MLNFNGFLEAIDSSADYKTRISQGKSLEQEIRDAMLRDAKLVTIPASSGDDKHRGIDAWIISKDSGKTKCAAIPIQIKARKNNSGSDILWETIKPWDQNVVNDFESMQNSVFTGKDMKCKSQYIFSVSNDGQTLRIRKVEETIEIAKQMAKELVHNYRATGKGFVTTKWGEARITKDPSNQSNFNLSGNVMKVNSFINPNSYEWKLNVKLTKPIGVV